MTNLEGALCTQYDPEIWFATQNDQETVVIAKKICALCPIRVECAQYAIEHKVTHGIIAGYSAQSSEGRKKLRQIANLPGRRVGRLIPPCRMCNRPMRDRNDRAVDFPGTVRLRRQGMCETCCAAWERGYRVGPNKVAS